MHLNTSDHARGIYLGAILEQTNADILKTMVAHWGGLSKWNKMDCVHFLLRTMPSQEGQHTLWEHSSPFERAALSFIKSDLSRNKRLNFASVALRAAMTGANIPIVEGYYGAQPINWLQSLFEKGIILNPNGYGSRMPSEFYGGAGFTINSPAIAFAPQLDLSTLPRVSANPAPRPQRTLMRRPQAVALNHLSFVRALETVGEIKVNKTGAQAIAAASNNKIIKALLKSGWTNTEDFTYDGQLFVQPISAYTVAARWGKLLKANDSFSNLTLTISSDQFAELDYARQTGYFLSGITAAEDWLEDIGSQPAQESLYDSGPTYVLGRELLLMALQLLPAALQTDFVSIKALSQMIFQGVGEYFSIQPHRPFRPFFSTYRYGRNPSDQVLAQVKYERELADWRVKITQFWHEHDEAWLQQAFSSWLYAWGVVELGFDDSSSIPTSFRLTDLGRAVLGLSDDETLQQSASSIPDVAGAWVVQPNFEVLVYLDRASPAQLALLERYAERIQTNQHTANYRLTKQSVYEALERGGAFEMLIGKLTAGAANGVPNNVQRELQEWTAQREQYTLRQVARLVEFPTPQAREEAIRSGLKGNPVGERFLIIERATKFRPSQLVRIDYAQPRPPSLHIDEEALITADHTNDLLVLAQLNQWAKALPNDRWQLTQASVAAAAKKGARYEQLEQLLLVHSKNKLPRLIEIALRAWSGEWKKIELEQVIVLRCVDATMLQALANSRQFKGLLRGTIAPNIALVKRESLDELKAQLAWLGLEPGLITLDV